MNQFCDSEPLPTSRCSRAAHCSLCSAQELTLPKECRWELGRPAVCRQAREEDDCLAVVQPLFLGSPRTQGGLGDACPSPIPVQHWQLQKSKEEIKFPCHPHALPSVGIQGFFFFFPPSLGSVPLEKEGDRQTGLAWDSILCNLLIPLIVPPAFLKSKKMLL